MQDMILTRKQKDRDHDQMGGTALLSSGFLTERRIGGKSDDVAGGSNLGASTQRSHLIRRMSTLHRNAVLSPGEMEADIEKVLTLQRLCREIAGLQKENADLAAGKKRADSLARAMHKRILEAESAQDAAAQKSREAVSKQQQQQVRIDKLLKECNAHSTQNSGLLAEQEKLQKKLQQMKEAVARLEQAARKDSERDENIRLKAELYELRLQMQIQREEGRILLQEAAACTTAKQNLKEMQAANARANAALAEALQRQDETRSEMAGLKQELATVNQLMERQQRRLNPMLWEHDLKTQSQRQLEVMLAKLSAATKRCEKLQVKLDDQRENHSRAQSTRSACSMIHSCSCACSEGGFDSAAAAPVLEGGLIKHLPRHVLEGAGRAVAPCSGSLYRQLLRLVLWKAA
ncbi:hypothetical protein CYMTET_24481 [Cymbomonas tetramitiformis]|uniref:Uncharacterized protein n=1 Tax=Cymbomonas tetramitiformis TaxID=36881 RepID=A0AAE0L074_9CHLO|nr:hypothetical protein CYMTET_24481 [Cymbomonas tetramitiformis]